MGQIKRAKKSKDKRNRRKSDNEAGRVQTANDNRVSKSAYDALVQLISDTGVHISRRAALIKLLPENDDNKVNKDNVVSELLEQNWVQLSTQRDILLNWSEAGEIPKGENAVGFAKYLMQEYPSHLVHEWDNPRGQEQSKPPSGDNAPEKPNVDNVPEKKIEQFLRTRISSIKWTTAVYWISIGFFLLQLIAMLVGFIISNAMQPRERTDLCAADFGSVLALKVIGLLLLASIRAWYVQLWKDEEVYGQALGNISEDEPIDRILEWLPFFKSGEGDEKNEVKKIVVSDWLKNRPSFCFLVIVALNCIYLEHVLALAGIPQLQNLMNSYPLSRFCIQLLIGSAFFFFSLPWITDFRFIKILFKNEEARYSFFRLVLFNSASIIFWLLLFALPALLTTMFSQKWIAAICMVVVGVMIYLMLLVLTKLKQRQLNSNDAVIIRSLKSKDEADLNGDLNSGFGNASSKGQMKILNLIQNGDLTVSNNVVSALAGKAHTPQIMDLILDICSNPNPKGKQPTDADNKTDSNPENGQRIKQESSAVNASYSGV